MSETWVIKDTAPVDESSRELATQQCSFASNGQSFGSISIVDPEAGAIYVLKYDEFEVAGAEVGLGSYAFDWSGNEAYKTLVFDTAPTGELLAWLQKNADKQDKAYLAKESELKDIADAIRSVGGTTDPLVFPDGFAAAIGTLYIITMSQSEYTAASAAGTLDESKWYGVYPDA